MALSSVLLAAGVATPASACEKSSKAPRYTAEVGRETGPGIASTSVVRCDRRTGRTRVLRRARLVGETRGTEIVDVALAGRRLAWVERSLSPKRRTLTLRTADAFRLDIRKRRVLVRGARAATDSAAVVVTSRDDVLYSFGPEGASRLWSWRSGGRIVSRGPGGAAGAFLVDGFSVIGADRRPLDLRPRPRRDGCPWRPSVRSLASSDQVAINVASSVIEAEESIVWWVCDRDTGREATIHSSFTDDVDYHFTDAVSVADIVGHHVLLAVTEASGHSYDAPDLWLVDGRSGELTRKVDVGEWPSNGNPEAVLFEDGSFAWIAANPVGGMRLVRLARPGSEPATLDTGGPGLTGLAISGRTLTWTNDGVARSYELASPLA